MILDNDWELVAHSFERTLAEAAAVVYLSQQKLLKIIALAFP